MTARRVGSCWPVCLWTWHDVTPKAPSTPAKMLRQHCRSDNVEATLSNATRRTILSTKSNVASTLLPFSATTSNECFVKFRFFSRESRNALICSISFDFIERTKCHEKHFQHCYQNGNNVEATFDFVKRIIQLVAFDIVASTLLLWLKVRSHRWDCSVQSRQCEQAFNLSYASLFFRPANTYNSLTKWLRTCLQLRWRQLSPKMDDS